MFQPALCRDNATEDYLKSTESRSAPEVSMSPDYLSVHSFFENLPHSIEPFHASTSVVLCLVIATSFAAATQCRFWTLDSIAYSGYS